SHARPSRTYPRSLHDALPISRSTVSRSKRKSGELDDVHATPASTNGTMSIGMYGKLMMESGRGPKSGILISRFSTPSLEPFSLSYSGQRPSGVGVHSEMSNEP